MLEHLVGYPSEGTWIQLQRGTLGLWLRVPSNEIQLTQVDMGALLLQAIARASIECSSSGNAVACGEAMVSANAWARAAASAHGEAVYKATSADCNCTNATVVEGFAESSKLVDLISEATSNAEVQACSRDGLEASAEAFSDCTAVAYVQIFATSVADVVLQGVCPCIALLTCGCNGRFFWGERAALCCMTAGGLATGGCSNNELVTTLQVELKSQLQNYSDGCVRKSTRSGDATASATGTQKYVCPISRADVLDLDIVDCRPSQ
jgi:hypothetical protein